MIQTDRERKERALQTTAEQSLPATARPNPIAIPNLHRKLNPTNNIILNWRGLTAAATGVFTRARAGGLCALACGWTAARRCASLSARFGWAI